MVGNVLKDSRSLAAKKEMVMVFDGWSDGPLADRFSGGIGRVMLPLICVRQVTVHRVPFRFGRHMLLPAMSSWSRSDQLCCLGPQ